MSCIIRNSITINLPIETVFAFVTDPAMSVHWQTNLIASKVLTSGPMGLGTRVEDIWQVGRGSKQNMWEITVYEPPIKRDYIYIDKSRSFQETSSLLFTFVNNRTLVQSIVTIETHFPFTLCLPQRRYQLQLQNERNYAQLKRFLEAEKAP